jgi:UDP-N-acetylmuramoyl-L-alanyl-D-glutamate--2,6-diaminopimelate ligase
MTFSLEAVAAALDGAGLLAERRGALPRSVGGIADDSRNVTPGSLFLAIRGTNRDGHDFLDAAEEGGAVAALVEDPRRTTLPALVVTDGRRAAAITACVAYDRPADSLRVAAVTGTNGKSTTVHILRHLLDGFGGTAASIGTIGVLTGSEGEPMAGGSGLTTPGPVELQRVFRTLVDSGVRSVSIEVSSHALEQHRVEGMEADVAVFTSFSRDHLDYHRSMERYFESKARLCRYLRRHGTLVVNADEPAWAALRSDRRRVSFSMRVPSAEVHATDISLGVTGSRWTLGLGDARLAVELPLIGAFNISNALAAAAAAWSLGLENSVIAERLGTTPQVPGRLERILDAPLVLRDYAHTPDALERALDAVRDITTGRVIVVFGCGGDRDRGKRPEMGAVGARKSDLAIVTSDNPRGEDPECILDEITAGMAAGSYERIEDRKTAIARALELATSADTVLLAGKGHETYQLRGVERVEFDERAIVLELSGREASLR